MIRTRTRRFLSAILFLALVGGMLSVPSATAQHEEHNEAKHERHAENQGKMQHREGSRHEDCPRGTASQMHSSTASTSGHPLRRATMQSLVLPALADTLGLSADQTRRLEELRTSLLSEQKTRREELHAQKKEAHQLFQETAMPDPEAVRTKMEAVATQRANVKAAPYETAAEMREVLTEEQQTRLSELSRQARHHEVMANMTMQEHMHMKRALNGNQHGGARGPNHRDSHMSTCQMMHKDSETGGNHGQHHGGAGK